MKNLRIMVILTLLCTASHGQPAKNAPPAVIQSYPLSVTCFKTTTLVFPFAVKSVDRGSWDVLAQKAKGVENVLWVKAARREMEPTSLTVITPDGKLYSYLVEYAPNPTVLTLTYAGSEPSVAMTSFHPLTSNESQLAAVARKVAGCKKRIRGKKAKNAGMTLRLKGLYIREDVIYCQFYLQNKTHLDYTIDQLRFTIIDRRQPRRTASQEREIKPLFTSGNTAAVKGRSEQTVVFALPKFTMPDQKYLTIQIMEQNGGRHLTLEVGNRTLVRAVPINL